MKRIKFVKILIVIMIAITSCIIVACHKSDNVVEDKNTTESQGNYKIYCTDAEGSSLVSWEYKLEGDLQKEEKLSAIMEAFKSEPSEKGKKTAVPEGLSDITFEVQRRVANINLDKSYNNLNSLEKLFFKAALVLTVTQIDRIDYVYITVNGQPLVDEDGVDIRYFTQNSFVMYDDSIQANESDLYLTLYYVNDTGDKLVARDETYQYDRSMSPELYVLECLQLNDVVLNAYTKNGICYVDLNEKINDKGFVGMNSEIVLYAMVNSLMELKDVTGVKLSICGRDDVLFGGEISLEGIFTMNLDIIE